MASLWHVTAKGGTMFTLARRTVLGTALLSIATMLIVSQAAAQEYIEIPAGTTVRCSFNKDVDPTLATIGLRIVLRTSEAIVINQVTVIEAGATVLGEVTQSQTRGAVGKPAIIGVTLYTVTAVDGSNIPLAGQKVVHGESKQTSSLVITILCCVLGLLQKGGEAVILEDSEVVGTILSTARVYL